MRLSLLARKKAVTTLLRGKKKGMIEFALDSEDDFGKHSHDVCREPFFYDAAYTFEHLSEKSKGNIQHDGREHAYKYKPLPCPIYSCAGKWPVSLV